MASPPRKVWQFRKGDVAVHGKLNPNERGFFLKKNMGSKRYDAYSIIQ